MGNRYLLKKIDSGLADNEAITARKRVVKVLKPVISKQLERYPDMGRRIRSLKEQSIGRLPQLVEQAVASLAANGIKVFRAKTHREALAYLDRVFTAPGLVIKSKSNAVKEIGLPEHLKARGFEIMETDMGDYICQVGDIPHSHPFGPAIHLSVDRVANIISKVEGTSLEADHKQIVGAVRKQLRRRFFQATYGLTGANAIAADTGSILLAENEGNIRACTSMPGVHVAVAGIEKIVPTIDDGLTVIKATAVFGVGQDLGTYVSVISGPACENSGACREGLQGPGEVHLVLLEEGRWEAIAQGFQESLYCLNCGSCQNACPVYNQIGGQYGYKYFGGIGVIQTFFRHGGLDKSIEAGLSLCIGCRRCVEACANSINTPDMIVKLRARAKEKYGLPIEKRILLEYFLPQRYGLWRLAPGLQKALCRRDPATGGLLRLGAGIERDRLIPGVSAKTFMDTYPEQIKSSKARLRVAYFPGCLNNLVSIDVGSASIKALNILGVDIHLPRGQMCCGFPMLMNGDLETARAVARSNLEVFAGLEVDAIVTDCATCLSGLKGYRNLLAGEPAWRKKADKVAGLVNEITEFILSHLGLPKLGGCGTGAVTYHEPCHLRDAGITAPGEILAKLSGAAFRRMEEENACCGFGGTFSLDYYKLARQINQNKVHSISQTGSRVVLTACPGCVIHLKDGLNSLDPGIKVRHVMEFIADYLIQG